MIDNGQFKRLLEDLNRANSAMMGISKVLEKIECDSNSDTPGPLVSGYVRGCLISGLESLSNYVDIKLDIMHRMAA